MQTEDVDDALHVRKERPVESMRLVECGSKKKVWSKVVTKPFVPLMNTSSDDKITFDMKNNITLPTDRSPANAADCT